MNHRRERQKRFLRRFINGPVDFLIRHEIHPNMLSILGLGCNVLGAVFLALQFYYAQPTLAMIIPIVLILGGYLDILDGEVARRANLASLRGSFIDSFIDRISDAVIIIGLMLGGFTNYFIGFLMFFLFMMISYSRSKAENLGVEMMGVGLMERGERIILLSLALTIETWVYSATWKFTHQKWVINNSMLSLIPITPFFAMFLIIFTILLVVTLLQRVVHVLKLLKD